MFHTIKISPSNPHKLIHTTTSYPAPAPSKEPKPYTPRSLSEIDSPSYKRSLRRAYARSKLLAFFNSDLQYFITFTYKQNITDYKKAQHHIKQFLKQEKRYHPQNTYKYIYVFEYQKRGAIHVHMVSNSPYTTYKNKNGYESLLHWKHGFSSVLRIEQTDNNFKPYLYLFKYMHKTARIGKSFIHVSRNFAKIENVDYALYINRLSEGNILFTEDIELYVKSTKSRITKRYIESPPTDAHTA